MNEALVALAAKLISLPVAAKGAVGATAAAAAIGTAGATGVMPIPTDVTVQPAVEQSAVHDGAAQRGVAQGRSAEAPGRSGEARGRSAKAPGRSGEARGRSGEVPGRPAKAGFGQSTAADARDGGVDGAEVAARARATAAYPRPVGTGRPERAPDAAQRGGSAASEDARAHGRGGEDARAHGRGGEGTGRDGRPTKDRAPATGRP